MRFALAGTPQAGGQQGLADGIAALLEARGHARVEPAEARLVFNFTRADRPETHFLRTDASVFVATLVESATGDAWPDREALRRATYAVLVKTMSNLVVHSIVGGAHGGAAYTITPELGFRARPIGPGLAAVVVDAVTPLAAARVVIANRLEEDLPPELWNGDEAAQSLMAHGRRLAAMNLLPSAFDIASVLDERDLRTVRKVFGLKQISYGNLSVRRDADSFWMSGRGVDKGRLEQIGRDVFLVKGYDAEQGCMVLSVPPGTDPDARVSVDAIEHYKIYASEPQVGAVVHVHAWMPGVEATSQGWPCGTEELADEVLAIVRRQPEPARAVVGLKNHGLTLTGPSLEDVFARMDGRLSQDVPVLD